MKNFLVLFVIILFVSSVSAQVVNIEKKRIGEDDEGISGSIDLSIGLTETESKIIQGDNNVKIQYKRGKNTFLLFNNLTLIKAGDQKLINDGFQHVRYNYRFEKPAITWEIFAQHQYNTVTLIKRRTLIGTGPRLRIIDNDTTSVFFGPMIMYENEILTDDSTKFETARLSVYFSFAINVSDNFSINHISYYQPVFNDFEDYRIASETSLKLDISKSLAFKIIFDYSYDSKPPLGINKNFYSIANSISYSF